jgi:hypothetical protein
MDSICLSRRFEARYPADPPKIEEIVAAYPVGRQRGPSLTVGAG